MTCVSCRTTCWISAPRPWPPPRRTCGPRCARPATCLLRCVATPGPWDLQAIDDALDEGDEILDANSHAIFGPMRPGRPTRIMVTLPGEAADDPELVSSFVDAGMDVARINCAHDDPAAWARMAASVRAAAGQGRGVRCSCRWMCRVPSCGPGPSSTGHLWAGPASPAARAVGSWPRPGSGSLTLTPRPRRPGVHPRRTRATLSVQVDGTGWLLEALVTWSPLHDTRGAQAHVHGDPGGQLTGCWLKATAMPTSPTA
jgi:hypothetical protein